jgi:outer membrane receptor for ferrienterochelin and colicins
MKSGYPFIVVLLLSMSVISSSYAQSTEGHVVGKDSVWVRLMEEVVVTATRTARRKSDVAVLTGVLDRKALASLPVCALSDALSFQPGLRVEVNCQTCQFSQLRMNGLAGGYSQILINGRPVFSGLMSLYGLEQIPAELIERIEVVRGGGSSLYGTSAIGGTVNVITRMPDRNALTMHSQYQHIGGQADEFRSGVIASGLSRDRKAGLSFVYDHRNREAWDAQGDGLSEMPRLRSDMVSVNGSWKPSERLSVDLSLTGLGEYRYGGDLKAIESSVAAQAEERHHSTWMGTLSGRWTARDERTSVHAFAGWQRLHRRHFTGVLPEDPWEQAIYLKALPFGGSSSLTLQSGLQIDRWVHREGRGRHRLSGGFEYLREQVSDSIPAYKYAVDQLAEGLGSFVQSDWELLPRLTLLSGIRADLHNRIPGRLQLSPRISLLFKTGENARLRLSYGSGFRAPQAFDADLHTAFAGGGVSRAFLAPGLRPERAGSLGLSYDADHPRERWIIGYTFDLFHTRLQDVFVNVNTGRDASGEVFEKRNGDDASVYGMNLEFRVNLNRKFQWETGWTLQRSLYELPVEPAPGLAPERNFLRTPDTYGFSRIDVSLGGSWKLGVSHVFTGSMRVLHLAGGGSIQTDRVVQTPSFLEHHLRLSRTDKMMDGRLQLESFIGGRNMTDARQRDFDRGPYRDSNYVYGPGMPRTFFMGIRVRGM